MAAYDTGAGASGTKTNKQILQGLWVASHSRSVWLSQSIVRLLRTVMTNLVHAAPANMFVCFVFLPEAPAPVS